MNNLEKIEFKEHDRPSLQAGEYTLKVSQEVKIDKKIKVGKAGSPRSTFAKFGVKGDRFQLNPVFVHSCYPPVNGNGFFEDVLPHIVFSKATLPWEYSAEKQSSTTGKPWLCLLVFDENEIGLSENRETKDLVTEQALKVGELPKDITDELKFGEEGNQICQVIHVPEKLINAVIPKYQDLHWLTHVRRVSTADKEDTINEKAVLKEGKRLRSFSVVVANRLPKKESTSVVYLVSVQGRQNDLPAGVSTGDKTFVYLKKWTFYTQPSLGRVHDYLHNKAFKPQPFRLNPELIENPLSKKYFSNGFIPANHFTRNNDKIVSWYRGPLVPFRSEQQTFDKTRSIFHSADEATAYDEDTGMFNLSYAAAWKLGQLLTLRNNKVSTAIYKMKSAVKKAAKNNFDLGGTKSLNPISKLKNDSLNDIIRAEMEQLLDNAQIKIRSQEKQFSKRNILPGPNTLANESNYTSKNNLISYYNGVMHSKADELSNVIDFTNDNEAAHLENLRNAIQNKTIELKRAHNPDMKDTFIHRARTALMGKDIIQKQSIKVKEENWLEYQSKLKSNLNGGMKSSGSALTQCIDNVMPQEINDWFADLSLLKDVPLAYLIPGSILLPEESLRFFHLDAHWIQALLDGANSIGSTTQWDQTTDYMQLNVRNRDCMLAAIDKRNAEALNGFAPVEKNKDTFISGVLLRSQVVDDWPGLEVEAYPIVSNVNIPYNTSPKLPLLRMERLSSDILLCLFQGSLKSIYIQEPSEGIHFGFDTSKENMYTIKLQDPRTVTQSASNKERPKVEIAATDLFRNGSANDRVLSIASISQKLEKALKEEYFKDDTDKFNLNAAEFGVQLVRGMQRVVFNAKDQTNENK